MMSVEKGLAPMVAKFEFGTKAETLEALAGIGGSFTVPTLIYFSEKEWSAGRERILRDVAERTANAKVAVRSSALDEDGERGSQAGAYETILNVPSGDAKALEEAIIQVFASYAESNDGDNQVLVQKMATNTTASGVIMTRVVDDGSPYYVFNYDDESDKTDAVTGGTGAHKTVLVYRGAHSDDCDSERLVGMLSHAREIEAICGSTELDIEFAIDKDGHFYLFQVRRIATIQNWHPDCQMPVARRMPQVRAFVQELSARRRGLYGDQTILGNMPDWNPAEIIGVHPSPMAVSLYKKLITSGTWADAREDMGYRRLPRTDLMVMIAGSPYIDVRASFNSFLPEGLEAETSEKLINAWLDRLAQNPELHDKVEFDVVPTSFDPDFEARFKEIYGDLLKDVELSDYGQKLLALTKDALDLTDQGTLPSSLSTIERLRQYQSAPDFSPPLEQGPISTAAWISATLDDCRRFGTLPFSIAARHGFIAESMLRSFVRLSAISADRIQVFKNSFPTVLGELAADNALANDGDITREAFLERYGHLRPGTYDIQAKTYRERSNLFSGGGDQAHHVEYSDFALTDAESAAIEKLLRGAGYDNFSAEHIFEYAKMAIAGREYAKFIFTRSLSAGIDAIVEWGALFNLGREELSLLRIDDLLDTATTSTKDDLLSSLVRKIDAARLEIGSDRLLKMGYLIRDTRDFNVVPIHRASPNYVTEKDVEGRVAFLTSTSLDGLDLRGKIVCIENADPGFDWIFSKNIAGLITKYGGANSHMAIRCAEMKLPAAIGCGDLIFSSLTEGQTISLSCKSKQIRS